MKLDPLPPRPRGARLLSPFRNSHTVCGTSSLAPWQVSVVHVSSWLFLIVVIWQNSSSLNVPGRSEGELGAVAASLAAAEEISCFPCSLSVPFFYFIFYFLGGWEDLSSLLALLQQGNRMVTISEGSMRVWRVSLEEHCHRVRGHIVQPFAVVNYFKLL